MQMTATEMGFYEGARIRRGQSFEFDESKGPAPRWAVPAGTALPPLVEREPVDTKPPEAMAAAHGKTGMRGTAPSAYDIKGPVVGAAAARKAGAGTFPTDYGT